MRNIKLTIDRTGSETCEIYVGSRMLEGIGRQVAKLNMAQKYFIVTDAEVAALYGEALEERLKGAGLETRMIAFPAGEESKNMETVLAVVRRLLSFDADRKSALIALGGGVVGDLTGFVAALYMRSIPYVQIPTTLVAQVDSSIGGKTAVDLPEGKNLLGAFYQPRAVFVDTALLSTLPMEQLENGLAEVIKYGIIDSGDFFRLLEEGMDALKERRPDRLLPVIERCCTIKKRLVEIDERDQGPRHLLNFGHTVGHALEAASGYGLAHGRGVALGMMAASLLSEKLCGLPAGEKRRIEALLARAGLPTRLPREIATDLLMEKLQKDKKKTGKTINFVLIKRIGDPFVSSDATESAVRETIEELKG